MKIIKIILGTILVLMITGCQKENNNQDFWVATINVLEDKLENNNYSDDTWQINVEDKTLTKDKNHRGLTIRKTIKNDNLFNTTMLSFQNHNNNKTISYHYIKNQNDKEQKLIIESINKEYKKYEIKYQNNNKTEAIGKLNIGTDNKITYDNIPLLKEAMKAYLSLIEDFQKDFKIDYHDYDFVNLPELAKDIKIPDLENIDDKTATTINYYSDVYFNAKGFSLVTFLEIEKDFLTAQFGIYNIERKGYESNDTVTLEKRSIDNCYNLIQKNDPDINYAVYLDNEIAYIYQQSKSDQEIQNDISNNGALQAVSILKTTNKSY
ncbi:MAG: hypothetical protein ACLR9T_01615 [Thomasclavelia sp.]|uniref:hypothetical protein n=1 Tax=Thomasclavelia sp. TaxID=3025757 RepID=UPI0039A231CF